ncbi:purine and uridine phosphorylase, partial [Polychaeton citri CBS 116435]
METPSQGQDAYHIGIICASELEMFVLEQFLDEKHPSLRKSTKDYNKYTLGRMGRHHVAIAYLNWSLTGETSVTASVESMLRSFPIRIGLSVGVCGGVWSEKVDMRLGDVIVSQQNDIHGGVVKYDFSKARDGEFRITGLSMKPPRVISSALQSLRAVHRSQGNRLSSTHADMLLKPLSMTGLLKHQGTENDQLFEANYNHFQKGVSCHSCDPSRLVLRRPDRTDTTPRVHYGTIALSNQLIEDGLTRDRIAKTEGMIGFEREAAGFPEGFPCILIRGVCDYTDSHRNRQWKPYAIAAATAFVKELLYSID